MMVPGSNRPRKLVLTPSVLALLMVRAARMWLEVTSGELPLNNSPRIVRLQVVTLLTGKQLWEVRRVM